MKKQQLPPFELGSSLWRAARAWRKRMSQALRPVGLTLPQYLTLRSIVRLSARPGWPPNQCAISEDAGLDKMSVSQAVRSLERRGLVDRDIDGLDARHWRVIAMDSGRSLLARARPLVRSRSRQHFAPLEDGSQALARQLSKLEP